MQILSDREVWWVGPNQCIVYLNYPQRAEVHINSKNGNTSANKGYRLIKRDFGQQGRSIAREWANRIARGATKGAIND